MRNSSLKTVGKEPVSLSSRLMAAILLGAAVPRVVLAVTDHGIFWPDEIFQSLEQAHRVAFGYGFIPWEFQAGARSWLFPGALGLLWKIAAAVGVRSAIALVVLAKLVIVAVALVGIYATIRIAEQLAGAAAGWLAGLLAATFPAALIFGHRCTGEIAGGSALVVAVWLWLNGDRRRMFWSGLIASMAIFVRYQMGLAALGLLLALLVSPRRRMAIPFGAGAAVGLLGGEILDWITWGRPFHSLAAYWRYNVGHAADYGVSPWSYYFAITWSSAGVSCLAIAVGVLAAWSRARALVAIVIAFVVIHSAVGHKEYRYIMPIVPLLLALAAVGLAAMTARLGRGRGVVPAAAIAMSVLMVVKTAGATLASTGQWADQAEGAKPVWHHLEGANLALAEAGQQSDACGVLLAGVAAIWSGGFTYLHRDVPFLTLYDAPNAGELLPMANYVVLAPEMDVPPGYVRLKEFRGWSLHRRDGGCAPPPPTLTRAFPIPPSN